MSAAPTISAIVANWNGARELTDCLPSVMAQDYAHLEVIVVDNGSGDRSWDVVKQHGAQWVPLGRNAGLAAALNAAARIAKGELLLFLNNDIRLHRDCVRTLAAPLLTDPAVFAADALQWDWEGRVRVHGRTRFVPRPPWRGCFDLRQDFPPECAPSFMASAANALVRRWMFETLGGWDPAYFIGWEDVDLFWRAWKHGWRTVFVPHAVCWHKVRASAATAAGADIRFRAGLDGHLYFAAKCLPMPGAVEAWTRASAGLLRDVATLRWRNARQKARAIASGCRSLPSAIRSRREMYPAGSTPQTHMRALARMTRH